MYRDGTHDAAPARPRGRDRRPRRRRPDPASGDRAGRAAAPRASASSVAGTFASNIGTWMQNVLLGAYGYTLTHSTTYVGLLFFAQLGPLLLLSNIGGVLADMVDRRRLLLWCRSSSSCSRSCSRPRARVAPFGRADPRSCVLVIGVGNALGAPALSAILPTLVPRSDLPGAVSLQSVQMNLSRVDRAGDRRGDLRGRRARHRCSSSMPARTCSRSSRSLVVHYPRRRAPRGHERCVGQPGRRLRHRASRPAHPAAAPAARDAVVLLARVHRPHARARRRQPRHRAPQHRVRRCCTRSSASAPRSER